MNARQIHKILRERGYDVRPSDDAHMGVYDKDGRLVAQTLMPGRKQSKELTFQMKKFLRQQKLI